MAKYKTLIPTDKKATGEFGQWINGQMSTGDIPLLHPDVKEINMDVLTKYFEQQASPGEFDSKAFNKDYRLITVELIKYD